MTTLLPNGEQTFVDRNGDPITSGLVYSYVPGTTTPSNTYQDEGLTVANPNPVTLDQAGRCVMWGTGLFRQVVYDMFGTLQWDRETGFMLAATDFPSTLVLPGNLTVQGTTTLANLNVSGLITTQNINITGNSALGTVTSANFTFRPVFAQGILLDNNTWVDEYGADGSTVLNMISIDPSNNMQIAGNVPGKAVIGATGGLEVSHNLVVDGTETVSGAATFSSDITVNGVIHNTGGINTSSDIHANGNIEAGGLLFAGSSCSITTTLSVGGNTEIDGNLTVAGTINGAPAAASVAAAQEMFDLTMRLTALEEAVRSLQAGA